MTASIERRANEWLTSGDTGASSKTLCRHMLGLTLTEINHPHDPDDLGRCLRLLLLIPEWEERIPEMAALSASLAALVGRWGEIVALMNVELGRRRYKGEAPQAYALMRQVLDKAEAADGWVTLGPGIRMRARL